MKPSAIYSFQVPAFSVYQLPVIGEYFKILSADGPVDARAEWGTLKGLVAGQGLESTPFQRLEITDVSGANNNLRIFIGDEKFIDGLGGTVNVGQNVVPRSSNFANSAKVVTNASTQMLAANAARQYLLVQNKAGSGDVYLSFVNPATVANGVRVVAGGFLELSTVAPTGAVYAIGSIANNPDVVVLEG